MSTVSATANKISVSEALSLLRPELASLMPVSALAFFALEETLAMRCLSAAGTDAYVLRPLLVPLGEGVMGRVARNKSGVANGRPSSDIAASGIKAPTQLQSALACPVMFSNRLIGALAVYSIEPKCYTRDHCRHISAVCTRQAALIHSALTLDRASGQDLTDELTGLPNMNFFYMYAPRVVARAKRLHDELSLLFLDVDALNRINDQAGFHVGDRALREVAIAIRTRIAAHDVGVHWMSDKFLVILPSAAPDPARDKLIELRSSIAEANVQGVADGQKLSFSAGLATFPYDGEEWPELLDCADSRMQYEKSSKRNDT